MIAKPTPSGKRVRTINAPRRKTVRRGPPPLIDEGSLDFGMGLSVWSLSDDAALRNVVARYLRGPRWPRLLRPVVVVDPYPVFRVTNETQPEIETSGGLVYSTITIGDYITEDTPVDLRVQKRKIRGIGEAVVAAADMYRIVYDVDAGVCIPYPRVVIPHPYTHSHGIRDLAFEGYEIRWADQHRKACEIRFHIGS